MNKKCKQCGEDTERNDFYRIRGERQDVCRRCNYLNRRLHSIWLEGNKLPEEIKALEAGKHWYYRLLSKGLEPEGAVADEARNDIKLSERKKAACRLKEVLDEQAL